jgi:hypothetical protein
MAKEPEDIPMTVKEMAAMGGNARGQGSDEEAPQGDCTGRGEGALEGQAEGGISAPDQTSATTGNSASRGWPRSCSMLPSFKI